MLRSVAQQLPPDVIDSSDDNAMQSLLEEKARALARLQHQVEELQRNLEGFLAGGQPSAPEPDPSLQQASPPQAPAPQQPLSAEQAADGAFGRNLPRRITVSLNDHVHQLLIERSQAEGRSVSNLAAFILEAYLVPYHNHP